MSNVNDERRAVRRGTTGPLEWTASAQAVTRPDDVRDLKRALAKLSEEMRTVVLLIGQVGMSYHEAAAVLKVPCGHRALAVVERPGGIK